MKVGGFEKIRESQLTQGHSCYLSKRHRRSHGQDFNVFLQCKKRIFMSNTLYSKLINFSHKQQR